jgi:hypothetical protein
MAYGRMYFTPDPNSMFIPSIPDTPKASRDVNRREQKLFPIESVAEWRSKKQRWSFSKTTGELESPHVLLGVDGRDINQVLARAWNDYGKDAVKRIILNISVECREDATFALLRHYGFERAGHRETKVPQLVYVGPAKRWRIKSVSDAESEAEEDEV